MRDRADDANDLELHIDEASTLVDDDRHPVARRKAGELEERIIGQAQPTAPCRTPHSSQHQPARLPIASRIASHSGERIEPPGYLAAFSSFIGIVAPPQLTLNR